MNRVLDDARDLISRGKSQEAILFLRKAVKSNSISCDKECYDQLTLLSSRLENLEITIRKGIISHRDANLEKNKITDDLLKFIASSQLIKVEKPSENSSQNLPAQKATHETNITNNVSGEKNILIQGSKGGVFNITNQ